MALGFLDGFLGLFDGDDHLRVSGLLLDVAHEFAEGLGGFGGRGRGVLGVQLVGNPARLAVVDVVELDAEVGRRFLGIVQGFDRVPELF